MQKMSFNKNNDYRINMAIKGIKRAELFLYGDEIPLIKEKRILLFDNDKEACVIEIEDVIVTEFKDITKSLVILDGTEDLELWKVNSLKYLKSIDKSFNESSKVVFVIFNVVENLIEKRHLIGKKITETNKKIFGQVNTLSEINSGFNNTLFNVNEKFIIKVCTDEKNKDLFLKEYNFYLKNKNNKNIPKFYKFDNSNSKVPYTYEIIEKVNGKTLYYYWYKMSEFERREIIKKLISILKEIHMEKTIKTNWKNEIKNDVLEKIEVCKKYFSSDEYEIVISAIKVYDKYLLDENIYSVIHNDLHFDNIMYDGEKLTLIDFNDYKNAPIDFEFRLLYMCKYEP